MLKAHTLHACGAAVNQLYFFHEMRQCKYYFSSFQILLQI